MLTDINPQLIIKLKESRNKRMLILDRDMKEKRKDIEQRSIETCAVSTSHLESFQLKAEMKCKVAAEESQNVLLSLEKILHHNQHQQQQNPNPAVAVAVPITVPVAYNNDNTGN